MNYYKYIQIIKGVVIYPIKIIGLIILLPVVFICTDFNDKCDRDYGFNFIKEYLKVY